MALSGLIYYATPRLGFGPAAAGSQRGALAAAGVTHVVDLRAEATDVGDVWRAIGVQYLRVPQIDDGRRQPAASYVQIVGFVAQALRDPRAVVLIHCAAGQYRSPGAVYAVLRAAGLSAQEAWSRVQSARTAVYPQYVPGADAALGQLPRIDAGKLLAQPGSEAAAGSTSWLAIGAAISVGYLAYRYASR